MEKFENYKKSKNISISSNNYRKYDITIELELNSLINIIAIEKENKIKYFEHYDLDNLRKIKYFSLFDSIDEIFEEIKDKITKKEPQLHEESNSLQLIIFTGNTKFKEINFNIKKNEKEYNEKINEIFIIINEFKEIERKQNSKINLLEDRINNLNKVISELNKRNNELEEELIKIKDKLINKNRNHYIKINRRYRQRYIYRRKYYYQNNNSSNYNPKLNYNDKKDEKTINENIFENEIQCYPKIEGKKEEKKKSTLARLLEEIDKEGKREDAKQKKSKYKKK